MTDDPGPAVAEKRAKHTAGPWHALGTKVFGLDAVVSEQDHPRHYICGIPRRSETRPPGNPDQEANARLIASSPDLLEALRALVNFHDTDDSGAFNNAHWDKARAAIAKATI